MKKAFLISIATALTLSAQIVDGVAMTVNGRVVTMFEIVKLSESAKISRQDAIEKIIEKKLEEYELEKQNVKKISSNTHTSPLKILIDIFSGIGLGTFLGYHLDEYFATLPLFIFLFSIFGAIGGIYNAYKDALKL